MKTLLLIASILLLSCGEEVEPKGRCFCQLTIKTDGVPTYTHPEQYEGVMNESSCKAKSYYKYANEQTCYIK